MVSPFHTALRLPVCPHARNCFTILCAPSRLILQIHDELLVETAKDEIDIVKEIMEKEMMGAADMAVPLEIGISEGDNCYDAK